MNTLSRRRHARHHDRVILHIDLDCFYAQCIENRDPSLRSRPLGIKQKGILATCNYVARRHGVKKLMPIAEARRICPDLVLADGEDLSPFRDVSKRLYSLVRAHSWNAKVERLGLDEIFVDVSDIVSYNAELLNPHALAQSYFCLSRTNPELGFAFDATSFAGCVHGDEEACRLADPTLRTRLLLGSHLARYLRLKIEEEGYTSSCGVATNKLLAKLAGDKNKPRNQTTLLTPTPESVLEFMDAHPLRKVPGIGSKTARVLQNFVLNESGEVLPHDEDAGRSITAGQVRQHPALSAPVVERLLAGPGAEKGIGRRVWALLHGLDDDEVKPARDVPRQISIEDSFRGGLGTLSEIQNALVAITVSLLRRVRVDLLVREKEGVGNATTVRWLACPRTIRLSTRPYTNPAEGKPYNWARASRSAPLPSWVFSALSAGGSNGNGKNNSNNDPGEGSAAVGRETPDNNNKEKDEEKEDNTLHQTAVRLVTSTLLPLFHKLHPPSTTAISTITTTATIPTKTTTTVVGARPPLRTTATTTTRNPLLQGQGQAQGQGVQNNQQQGKKYNIGLINICVTNMSGGGADVAADYSVAGGDSAGGGGTRTMSIGEMFRRQQQQEGRWMAGFGAVEDGTTNNRVKTPDGGAVSSGGGDRDPRPPPPLSMGVVDKDDATTGRLPDPADPNHPGIDGHVDVVVDADINGWEAKSNDDDVNDDSNDRNRSDDTTQSRMSWEWDDDDYGDDDFDTSEDHIDNIKKDDTLDDDDDQDDREEDEDVDMDMDMDMLDTDTDGARCPLCGRCIPFFAVAAHERFHALGEE
ncbi:hypothetical protein VTJ04DRAFT_8789 [Mycothermus thermophilus]|uniref:uncharacterized protein n=1 Tax=Humicola insolens TaxID=85995 RepID=UPI003743E789